MAHNQPNGPNDSSPEDASRGPRLDSWKEIAAYLKRDVATVRRWEKRERLPVHRHHHEKLGSVYAYTSELAAWSEGRRSQIRQGGPLIGRQAPLWAAGVALLCVAIVVAVYWFRASDGAGLAPTPLRIAVHRSGTVASLVAGGLVDVLSRALSGVDIQAVEEPGMMSTLRAIDRGEVDLGLAFNLMAFHAAKTDQDVAE